MPRTARQIFGERATWYTTSVAHTDTVVLDRVVELARPWPGALLLDVASGAGHTAFALAPRVRHVIATDITPEMLVEGRKLKAERGVTNVEFQEADVADLPFGDEIFDIVTCRRAAHHFLDVARALYETKRVLRSPDPVSGKPGGRLVIDDRSVPEDDFVDVTMNHLDRLHDESHVREYRASEWERMLSEAGFTVEAIEPYTRHRPLSSLTANVEPGNVARIHAVVASLNDSQRAALNVAEKEGEIYTNHWYVMVVGVKRDA